MLKRFCNFKKNISSFQKGMTYVELIVVLSIFSVMTSIVLFNYNSFQAKIDIKVLANDIALKIVEAQKSALAGKWNSAASTDWKPSYGVYFDLSNSSTKNNFVYFADLNNSDIFEGNATFDDNNSNICSQECLENIIITKGNYISKIYGYSKNNSPSEIGPSFSVRFTRPDSKAVFIDSFGMEINNIDYIKIVISSPSGINSNINIYPSGRIEIK